MGLVLVIDDDLEVCKLMQRVLRHIGYDPECVCGGAAGWERLQNPLQRLPDLVVLDLSMPEVDGMEVLRRIRAHSRTRGRKVVIYSAVADVESQRCALERGANEYWVKSHLSLREMEERLVRLTAPDRTGRD